MTLKQFFSQDKISVGIVAAVAAVAGFIAILTLCLLIAHEPITLHLRWYGGLFIPLILLLRHYAKTARHPLIAKTLATFLFVSFIAFMFLLFQTHSLTFQ